MQRSLVNSYNMFDGVLTLAGKNQTKINSVPALLKGVGDLKKVSDGMTELFKVIEPPSGTKEARQAALEELVNAALPVAGAIHCFATESGDALLAGKTSFSPTSLAKGGPARFIARCEFISETAADKLESLEDQKITEETLSALDEKIKAGRKAAGLPRAYAVDRSAANKELKLLRRKANTILRNRIDKMMLQFRDSDTEFYAKFKAARRIVNSATTSKNHKAAVSVTASVTASAGRNGNGNGTTNGDLVPEVTR